MEREEVKIFQFTPELFTLEAAAHYLGVSKRTVEEYVATGMLPTHKLPGVNGERDGYLKRTLIRKIDLDSLIEQGKTA